jgi:hypothetical protein
MFFMSHWHHQALPLQCLRWAMRRPQTAHSLLAAMPHCHGRSLFTHITLSMGS